MKEQLPNFFSCVIDAVADPIFVKDEEHRFVLMNEAMCRFIGYSKQELLGKSDYDFFSAEEAKVFWEKDDEVFRDGQTVENVESLTGADGRTRIISTKKSIFVDDSGKKVLVGVIRDLTAVKEQETAMREARDIAERANRTKSQFVANASHELRTPLNGIVGMVDLLRDREWDDELTELLGVLKDSADNLLHLVNDVLDFASIETGRLELKSDPFSPRDLLESVTALFEPQSRKKTLDLRTEIQADVPRFLSGDANRIRQILVNLLSNAVKFTPPGGTITLYLCSRPSDSHKVGLAYEIKDNGIGIPLDQLDNVLLPFAKARDTDQGTGLGLAISHQLAQLLGGSLRLESPPAGGCRALFQAEFSLPAPSSPNQDTELAHRLTFPGLKVLVVEDDPVSQKVSTRTLQRLDCQVSVTPDGLEALALLDRESFDLILMDCRMPRLDGYETSQAIRKRGLTVPIVALTAHAFEEDRLRCLAAGMDEWLSKPLIRSQLVEVLERIFPIRARRA